MTLEEGQVMELLALIAICVADWGCAASHMAYTNTCVDGVDCPCGKQYAWGPIPPKRLPFYDRKIPIWGDRLHLVAGLRYLPMGMLAWLAFGNPLESVGYHIMGHEIWAVWWYLLTAIINSIGWQLLKRLHGKEWTLKMLWRRITEW